CGVSYRTRTSSGRPFSSGSISASHDASEHSSEGGFMKNQRGITLIGMVVVCIVIVLVAIGGLKIAPAYIEYFKVKKAISGIAQTNGKGTVQDVRIAFDRRAPIERNAHVLQDRKSTRLNSSHRTISYAVFCLKKKTTTHTSLSSPFLSPL